MSSNRPHSSSASKLLGSSSASNRSKFEMQRVDTEASDEAYWSCNKILEEPDEESVNNLTPRLQEDQEREANLLEETHNEYLLRKSTEITPNKEMYASKTTLETEESSFSKYEIESDSTAYDKRNDCENPLSLSVISYGDISNEERFISPNPAGIRKVPALNLANIRKSLRVTSLDTSIASTTDSKFEGRLTTSPISDLIFKSLSKNLYQGSDLKPAHIKNQLSQGKPVTNRKLTKGLKTACGQYYSKVVSSNRKLSSEENDSWRDLKPKATNKAFIGQHWDFKK